MYHIAINLTSIEWIVLLVVVTIFLLAIYFFVKTRKTLRDTLEENKHIYFPDVKKEKTVAHRRAGFAEPGEPLHKKRYETYKEIEDAPVATSKKIKHNPSEESMVQELKTTIAQQQKLLNTYLYKVEELENEGRDELRSKNEELEEKIGELEELLDKKDADLNSLKQQAATSQKMAARIEEVYAEFEQLQSKMAILERQASRANNLAMELEDTRGSFEAMHKELSRKQERLEEVIEENQNMKEEINLLEDKLSEANFQRQQLQKKVQFLTDLNNDIQSLSDTNKKLQTELRRIGELESMLNLMEEERNFLLKKKGK